MGKACDCPSVDHRTNLKIIWKWSIPLYCCTVGPKQYCLQIFIAILFANIFALRFGSMWIKSHLNLSFITKIKTTSLNWIRTTHTYIYMLQKYWSHNIFSQTDEQLRLCFFFPPISLPPLATSDSVYSLPANTAAAMLRGERMHLPLAAAANLPQTFRWVDTARG